MATRTHDIFTTIRTEGALLPPDLLQRIAKGDTTLEGLRPEDYHLSGEKINEAVNRAWNVLLGAWKSFQAAQRELTSSDIGTSVTRERWLLPLFRELDYGRLSTARAVEIDGKSYPISHRRDNVPIHLVSYQLDLDKRAPGVAGASVASPHSLLQVYLNRSDDMWGFVSNGRQLRILRDNASLTRQAYVEFDLEAMMNGEVYADFVLLWLLCHQSRVESERPQDFWLEKWMQTASQEGTRSLDQLRNQVEKAIACLGEGFLTHPQNHALRERLQSGDLIPQDYYRQLLRLVYRLLFLFVAEDRGLLLDPAANEAARALYTNYYSTRRLRHLAERFRGTRHHDLYHGLRLVMQLLGAERNGAGKALGLPVLGSYLFSNDAVTDIIGCEIGNRDLLEAIRALAFTEDKAIRALRPVDYKNLGPEELGSIYESLLELHPQINVPARTFTLATAGGNERKTTGSYYTPESLIQALLDSALDPVLREAAAQGEDAILDLKVCDPACGSGHFLIAAAHRMAKALASVHTGEEEPAPKAIREALRKVIGQCIYGVDINPMAVELCKVGLWMEALEPGKPLSFLDHHIRCGNSLLGTTPRLMAGGIPDEAFQPIEGDDKKVVSALLKQNKQERKERQRQREGQADFFHLVETPAYYGVLAQGMHTVDRMADDTLAAVRRKEDQYYALAESAEYQHTKLLADAWCAAFVWDKRPDAPLPMTDLIYRRLETDPASISAGTRAQVVRLADQYQFFHWHIEFSDVFRVPDTLDDAENEQTGWNGGFSVVLGNPPWDQIQPEEVRFFDSRAPEIADLSGVKRKEAIEGLSERDSYLSQQWFEHSRQIHAQSHSIRNGNVFPLTAIGKLNTYALFAELALNVADALGRVGMIVPTSIASVKSYSDFFSYLITNERLVSLIGFVNSKKIFSDIKDYIRFCLLTLGNASQATLAFMLLDVGEMSDLSKTFSLSRAEFLLLNPNTRTCPTFSNRSDAALNISIYERVPVLIHQSEQMNLWGISFRQGLFNMTSDSGLFQQAWTDNCMPLYEAKFIWHYDHRFSTYENATPENVNEGNLPQLTPEMHVDPYKRVLSRYWVKHQDVLAKAGSITGDWLIGFRDIASATNERTLIACVVPFTAIGNTLSLMNSTGPNASLLTGLLGNLNSFVLDYVVRQKVGGAHLNFYLVEQFPILPPEAYTSELLDFITSRVLELTYTAWDLQPFAQDVGWDGPPFVWDEERRFLMRCELDALYFHLYGIERDDVDYIMETFPIVKRKDIAAHGEYLTKRVILEMYDQMAELGLPDTPDCIRDYQTWLNPPPAHPSVAHPPKRSS